MFYDILLIIIFFITIIICYCRGAVKTLVALLITFVSYISSTYLGNLCANLLYTNIVSPSIQKNITETLGNSNVKDSINTINDIINSLPTYIKSILSISGVNTEQTLNQAFTDSTNAISNTIDLAFKGVLISFFSLLFTIIFYLVIRLLLRLTIGKLLINIFRISILKPIDKLFGILLGFVYAFLIVSFIAFLLKMTIPNVENIPIFMNESSINSSYIFYYIYNGNIFTGIFYAIMGV